MESKIVSASQQESILATEIDELSGDDSQEFAVRMLRKLCGQLAQVSNSFTRSSFRLTERAGSRWPCYNLTAEGRAHAQVYKIPMVSKSERTPEHQ